MDKFLNNLMPVARLLLAGLFLVAGLSKIGQYAGTQAYMASAGVPGALLPLVILLFPQLKFLFKPMEFRS